MDFLFYPTKWLYFFQNTNAFMLTSNTWSDIFKIIATNYFTKFLH